MVDLIKREEVFSLEKVSEYIGKPYQILETDPAIGYIL